MLIHFYFSFKFQQFFGVGFSEIFQNNLSISDRVNHAPIFKKSLKNETVFLGENVTFEMKILSDYHPTWTWFFQACLDDTECPKRKFEVKENLWLMLCGMLE